MTARTIAVTGVSRGLGREMARGFAAAGHRVLGCARSAAEIPGVEIAAVDVVEAAAVDRWAAGLVERHGPPDLVINNAALMNRPAPLWEIAPGEIEALIRVNLCGVINVIRALIPAMIAAGRGLVVNVSSGWGRSTSPEVAPYCASKWAIEGLSRALAAELPGGLGCVAVNPGIIDTDMLRTCWGDGAAGFPTAAAWAERAVPFLLGLSAADSGRSLDIGSTMS